MAIKRLATWAFITLLFLIALATLLLAVLEWASDGGTAADKRALAAAVLGILFLLLACGGYGHMTGATDIEYLVGLGLRIFMVAGSIWVVVVMITSLRQEQRWQLLIQPTGVPAVALDTSRYETWEACEAERVRMIQADVLQNRQPAPLVCQGLYSWWELLRRSSPREKRNRH